MTETPTENIKMSLEQMQQLDLYQTRLANIQNEIKVASKNLVAVQNDTARITKEKEYNQELLDVVQTSLKEAEAKVNSLNELHLSTTEKLDKLNTEIAQKTSEMTAKEMELKDLADEIEKDNLELSKSRAALNTAILTHNQNQVDFNKKVATLKEAISQF